MKQIPLSRNLWAAVSDRDYSYLCRWKWSAWKGRKTHYAARTAPNATGRQAIYMHRLVAARKGLPARRVDHADGNGLNNCRRNIRLATQPQNSANRGRQRNNSSGYKGVSRVTDSNRWRARIQAGGREMQLGTFNTPKQAACAYDKAAIRLHGRFAHLNFLRRK